MDRHIVAIGGGEMGRTKVLEDGSIKQYPVETLQIDKKAVELTGKKNPKILVIGTANHNNDGYFDVVKFHFENRLNCIVKRFIETTDLQKQINDCDAIYISGGDTRYMLNRWQEIRLNDILINAYQQGKVIIGYSAGAICWFDYYDNLDYKNEKYFKPELLQGLGILKGCALVHYDSCSLKEQKTVENLAKEKNIPFYKINNAESIIFKNESAF